MTSNSRSVLGCGKTGLIYTSYLFEQVLGVAFSDDATRMVTSSKDGTWAVWNIAVRYKQQEDPKRLLSRTQEVTMPHLYS
jgi:hypothetical protein